MRRCRAHVARGVPLHRRTGAVGFTVSPWFRWVGWVGGPRPVIGAVIVRLGVGVHPSTWAGLARAGAGWVRPSAGRTGCGCAGCGRRRRRAAAAAGCGFSDGGRRLRVDGSGGRSDLNPRRGVQQTNNLTPSLDLVLTCGKLLPCEVHFNSRDRSGHGQSRLVAGLTLSRSASV